MTDRIKHEACPHCDSEIETIFQYPLLEVTGVFNEVYNVSKRFPKGYVSPLFEEEVGIVDVPEEVFYGFEEMGHNPCSASVISVVRDGYIWTMEEKINNPLYKKQLIVPFETINKIVTPHLEHLASFTEMGFQKKEILYPDGGIRCRRFGSLEGSRFVRYPPIAALKDLGTRTLSVMYTLEPPAELAEEYPELKEDEHRIFMSLVSLERYLMDFSGRKTPLDTLFGSMTCKGKLY